MNIVIMTSLGIGRARYLHDAGESIIRALEYAHKHQPEKEITVQWHIATQRTHDDHMKQLIEVKGKMEKSIPVELLLLDSVVPACIGRNMIATFAPENSILINLDSDDEFTEKRLTMINEDTSVQVCGAVDYVFDNGSWVEHSFVFYTVDTVILTSPWFDDSFREMGRLDFMMSSVAIRREILLESGGYAALPWTEDTILAARISEKGYSLEVVGEIGMRYRKHLNQTTKKDYDAKDIFDAWL